MLEDHHVAYARDVATHRNQYEDVHGHGVKNPNIQDDGDKSFRTHFVGALAEVAVLVFYDEDPLGKLGWREDGKGGRSSDLSLYGWSIEVKATERPGPARLVVSKGRLKESDVFFLVNVGESGDCSIRGWATWKMVLEYNEPEESKPTALRGKNLYTLKERYLVTAKGRSV